ncbi:sugar ABC transporter ATP-binding protein [Cohnella hongkongensis]|uniref:Autoinducer 2 import ATP-binding protein LsrA n=1 Tax=Cohnella hongkongensis TaxID=178337 RepID=A0ABV9FHS0_9BACL
MEPCVLELRQIAKSYANNRVLQDINLQLKQGEIRALIGENGAGKTTLVKILLGLEQHDTGEILIDGKAATIRNPVQAQQNGLAAVFQEVNLFPAMSVIENVYFGLFGSAVYINWPEVEKEVSAIFKSLNIEMDLTRKVSRLTLLEKKIVEVVRAVCMKSRILLLDEATADLDEVESNDVLRLIKRLSESGLTVLFISHQLDEMMKIADTITIMREGKVIETSSADKQSVKTIISNMTQDRLTNPYPKIKLQQQGREVLKVEKINNEEKLRNISFLLRQGEIVGITGLSDSGCAAVARAIVGLGRNTTGKMYINRKPVWIQSPKDAIRHQIGYIPGDRNESLIHLLGIHQNLSLSNFRTMTRGGIIDLDLENRVAEDYMVRLGIRARSAKMKVKHLSAGNRQKVMIAKSLLTRAKIYLLEDPTKGLDVSSKVEVYNIMNDIVLHGGSILLISSDLGEVLGMCDRVLVMYRGAIVKELAGEEMNEKSIVYYASGEK